MRKEKERSRPGFHGFLQGALILTAGMFLVKAIGAFFKIPLKYAIGEYGMGLFNTAYNFYGPVFSLATVGFPVAVAKLVSENSAQGRWKDVRAIRRAALGPFLLFGAVGMALITLLAPVYCHSVLQTDYALLPMLALAPAILFSCVTSVYRGYFEGLRNMVPTAVSEVVEAIAKLFIGLSGAWAVVARTTQEYEQLKTVCGFSMNSPDEAAFFILSLGAAGAIFGVTCGSVFSMIYLSWRVRLRGDEITPAMLDRAPEPAAIKVLRRRLLAVTVPIAIGSVAMNVAGVIDATLLQGRLSQIMAEAPEALLSAYAGMIPELYLENPESVPTFLYGCYTLALTLYLLVPAITQAFGISALPNVTASWAEGNREKLRGDMRSVLKLTALFCFPAGLGLSALAGPICQGLYGESQSSLIAGEALLLLGLASLPAAMCTPLSSMLQAVGRVDLPVKLLAVAMGIKIFANYWLCSIAEINILGAAIGTLCCYLFYFFSQLWFLQRVSGVSLPLYVFGKPLLAASFCGGCSLLTAMTMELFGRRNLEILLLGIGIGVVSYVFGLLFLRGFEKKELRMLPGGQKITKMLEKRGWI